MKIFALDSSGPNCSVAIIDDENVIANFNINNGITHSETLLPLIDKAFDNCNLSLNDMDFLACSIGPGSFTGLRIGIATLKGFAISTKKEVIGIPTLLSLAYNVPHFDGTICSIMDARNDNVYSALYKLEDTPNQIGDYFTDSIDSLIDSLKNIDSDILFVGDGIVAYKDKLKCSLGDKAKFMPFHLNIPNALSIAKAAYDKVIRNDYNTHDNLHPLYLRKSQAERMMDLNEQDSDN